MTSGLSMAPEDAAEEAGYVGDNSASILLAQPVIKKAISEIKRYGAPIDGLTRDEILQFLAGIVRDEDCGLRERLRAADQAVKMEGWYAQKRTIEHVSVGGPNITISIEDAKRLVRANNEEINKAYRREFIVGETGVESIRDQKKPRRSLGPGRDEPAKSSGAEVQDKTEQAAPARTDCE